MAIRTTKYVSQVNGHANNAGVSSGSADATGSAGDSGTGVAELVETGAFAGYSFTPGDAVYIISGTGMTPGIYEVTGKTDNDTITLGSDPGDSSSAGDIVWRLNGAWTLQAAADLAVGGDEVRIFNDGTYTPSAAIDFDTQTGSLSSRIVWRGRNSGDSAYETATISGSSLPASTDLFYFSGATARYYQFRNLRLTAATRYCLGRSHNDDSNMEFYDCRFDNATSHGTNPARRWLFVRCEIDSNGGAGVYRWGVGTKCIGCGIHDNSGNGLETNAGDTIAIACLIFDNGGSGIDVENGDRNWVINCVIDRNTADGLRFDGSSGSQWLNNFFNNIISNNGGYGLNNPNGPGQFIDFNCYYNNTSGASDITTPGENNVTDDPAFVNGSDGSEDYRLQDSSPCKGTGFPGALPSGGGPGYMDIGAFQRQESGGGSVIVSARPFQGAF